LADTDEPEGVEQEDRGPTYDRWSYPQALSSRGYVLAVAVPVLVAALAFGVIALVAAGDDAQSGTTVRLPVAGYAPTSADQGTPVEGYLRVDDDQCVYLQPTERGGNEADQIWAVWPAGYRAILDHNTVTLYDADDRAVAEEGDKLSAFSTTVSVNTTSAEPCLPDTGDVVLLQSDPVVVQ
jgi:hypothetical protein